jgi:nicotinamidase-related amidase
MTKALLIIDIQNDYFPGGAMELVGSVEAAEVAAKIQQDFRNQGFPVINVQHIAKSQAANFFLPGTEGAEIHESVKPVHGELVVVKHFPNAFRETTLLESLKDLEVTELVIIGMMTHMCIDTTVRAASDAGFNVTVFDNACATKDLQHNETLVTAKNVQAAYLAALDGSFASVQEFTE